MSRTRTAVSLTEQRGFTLVELLVNLVIGTIIITAVYQLLITQNRLYMKQVEIQDVRGTLRAAANLLAYELRQASAVDGDIYEIAPDSISLRSFQAMGTVCRTHGTQPRLGLWSVAGDFSLTLTDSVAIFPGKTAVWIAVSADSLWQSGAGVDYCIWSGGNTVPTDYTLHVGTTLAGLANVQIGDPVRAFRHVRYGLYNEGGRWWLGRKVSGATMYEPVAGPLRSPADSGLAFIYYDASGATTTNPAEVSYVDIVLRGESIGNVIRGGGQAPAPQEDTLTMRVTLRG